VATSIIILSKFLQAESFITLLPNFKALYVTSTNHYNYLSAVTTTR